MRIFLFVTANEHERTAFEEKFVCTEEKYILGKTYYMGIFGNYPAAYIHIDEQGVTNPAAIPLVGQLVNELRPAAVIMVGIAFGVNEHKQKIGDVLVSDKILPYDSQKLLEDKVEYKELPKEVGFQLLNAFREYRDWVYYLPSSEQSLVYIGAILTGSRLINNYKYRTQLINDFADNKPIGGEMEAQGIYSMARLHGIAEWIIVKGICDWGYKKDNPNKEKDQETAARAAVDYCFHVFSRTGVFDSLVMDRITDFSRNEKKTLTKAQDATQHIQSIKNMAELRKLHYAQPSGITENICFYGTDYRSNQNCDGLRKLCQQLIEANRMEDPLFNIAIRRLAENSQNDLYTVLEILLERDIPYFNKYFITADLLTNPVLKNKFITTHFDVLDKYIKDFFECSFDSDKQYKLDDAFFPSEQISDLEQAFRDGYRITSLWGIPGSGKSFIARTFANTHRAEFPIVKFLRLNRTSKEQSLCDLVISSLRFNPETVSKCVSGSIREQFEIKFASFNSVKKNKLIIISGLNMYTGDDIESLLELDAHFILCADSQILSRDVKEIPIIGLSELGATELFEHYLHKKVDRDILKLFFEKINYHVGTIIFAAKLMTYHSLSVKDFLDKFNSSEVDKLQIPLNAGANMMSLTQYHYALFSFDNISKSEDELLILFALLPMKNYRIDFLRAVFPTFDFNCVISLSLKGYIDYDSDKGIVRCSPLVCRTYFELKDLSEYNINTVIESVKRILDFQGCKEFSEIEEKIGFGITLVDKLLSKKLRIDADLCVKIAHGYQLLCMFNDAQKYVDIAEKQKIGKDTKVNVIRIKIDIMVFRYEYQTVADMLDTFIKGTVWQQLSNKEQGELFYKAAMVYSFINSEKCIYYFKRSFYSFQKAELIVGELASLFQLIGRANNKGQIEHELKAYKKDSYKLLKAEPIWSFMYWTLKYMLKGIIGNIDILFQGTVNDLLSATNHNSLHEKLADISFKRILRSIQNKAREGSVLENAYLKFMDERENDENTLKKRTEGLIEWYSGLLKLLRTIDIPMNAEITALGQINRLIPKELEIIDKEMMDSAILKLFFDKFDSLPSTHNDKIIASTSFAQILISTGNYELAIKILESQIRILSEYLPQENQYPLVPLFETLADFYGGLQQEKNNYRYALSLQNKQYSCWRNALQIVKTIPSAYLKQAELLYYLGLFDSAISILEEHNCINCILCHCYYHKALQKYDEPSIMRSFLKKMFYVQKHVAICGKSCYAEKLYRIAKVFSNQKEPKIGYHIRAFLADKANRQSTSESAAKNCNFLSEYFYKKRLKWFAKYFMIYTAKFSIKGMNRSILIQLYQDYFLRANLYKEAKEYKRALRKQQSEWVVHCFSETAKYYYGKENVTVSDVVNMLSQEIDERLKRIKPSNCEIIIVLLSKRLNVDELLYITAKWRIIKRELRNEFFYNLIFNSPTPGFLDFEKTTLFLVVHELTAIIEELLSKNDICGAEDALFEYMNKFRQFNFLSFGKYFYHKISNYSEKELLEANFSRNEISDGLRAIEQRYEYKK